MIALENHWTIGPYYDDAPEPIEYYCGDCGTGFPESELGGKLKKVAPHTLVCVECLVREQEGGGE